MASPQDAAQTVRVGEVSHKRAGRPLRITREEELVVFNNNTKRRFCENTTCSDRRPFSQQPPAGLRSPPLCERCAQTPRCCSAPEETSAPSSSVSFQQVSEPFSSLIPAGMMLISCVVCRYYTCRSARRNVTLIKSLFIILRMSAKCLKYWHHLDFGRMQSR